MERHSVSDQPHELKYEARKEGTTQQAIKDAKAKVGNQRSAIEKKLK